MFVLRPPDRTSLPWSSVIRLAVAFNPTGIQLNTNFPHDLEAEAAGYDEFMQGEEEVGVVVGVVSRFFKSTPELC